VLTTPCYFDETRFRVRAAECGCRTQADIAARTGYSVDLIGQVSRGRVPSETARLIIATKLGATPDEIWPQVKL
jgi:hypothetical protein